MKIKLFFILPVIFLVSSASCFAMFKGEFKQDPFVIVLDAGHGGHDPGNLGNGYLEKDIALRIVLKVGSILEKDDNFKVIYTRKDDTFIDLFVRGEIANKANADLFVSVHCDSHTSDAHGAGTFVLGLHANKQNFEIAKKENSVIYLEDNYESTYANYDINSPESVIGLTIMQEEFLDQSIALAKMIQDQFTGKLNRNNRKVKQAGFIVLHQTFMPSVLVETGFLTNKEEGAFLNSKDGQSKMGIAIAEAIIKYEEAVSYKANQSTSTIKIEEPSPNTTVIAPEKTEQVTEAVKQTPQKSEVKKAIPRSESEKKNEVVSVSTKKSTPVKEVIRSSDVVVSSAPNTTVVKEEPKNETILKKELPVKKSGIVFKIQLLASGKDIPLLAENFKGLNTLSKEPVKNLFRYMYGNTDSYQQVKLLKNNADLKGYTSSFIVAYKDGSRIGVAQALKYLKE